MKKILSYITVFALGFAICAGITNTNIKNSLNLTPTVSAKSNHKYGIVTFAENSSHNRKQVKEASVGWLNEHPQYKIISVSLSTGYSDPYEILITYQK